MGKPGVARAEFTRAERRRSGHGQRALDQALEAFSTNPPFGTKRMVRTDLAKQAKLFVGEPPLTIPIPHGRILRQALLRLIDCNFRSVMHRRGEADATRPGRPFRVAKHSCV